MTRTLLILLACVALAGCGAPQAAKTTAKTAVKAGTTAVKTTGKAVRLGYRTVQGLARPDDARPPCGPGKRYCQADDR